MAVRARRCPNPLRVADLNGVLSERCDNDPRYNTSSASCVIVYRAVELSLSGGEPLAPPPPPPPPHGPDPTPPNPMTPSSRWRVDPMTVKITHDRRAPFDSSATDVDVAAQRGECERVQLCKQHQDLSLRAVTCQPRGLSVLRAGGWESTELTDLTIEFSDMQSAAGGRINRSVWSYKQQGFLKTQTSTLYTCKEDLLVQPRHDGGPACTGPGTAGPCAPHDCR